MFLIITGVGGVCRLCRQILLWFKSTY